MINTMEGGGAGSRSRKDLENNLGRYTPGNIQSRRAAVTVTTTASAIGPAVLNADDSPPRRSTTPLIDNPINTKTKVSNTVTTNRQTALISVRPRAEIVSCWRHPITNPQVTTARTP